MVQETPTRSFHFPPLVLTSSGSKGHSQAVTAAPSRNVCCFHHQYTTGLCIVKTVFKVDTDQFFNHLAALYYECKKEPRESS